MNRTLDLVMTNMNTINIKRSEGIVEEDKFHPSIAFEIASEGVKLMKSKKSPRFKFFRADYVTINTQIDNIGIKEFDQLFVIR